MVKFGGNIALLVTLATIGAGANASAVPRAADPCAAIGGQKWVSPKAVRNCFTSIKVNETLKANVCGLPGHFVLRMIDPEACSIRSLMLSARLLPSIPL